MLIYSSANDLFHDSHISRKMELEAVLERAHEEVNTPLKDFDCKRLLNCPIEDVTEEDLTRLILEANYSSIFREPNSHQLWTNFRLSLPVKANSSHHNLNQPSSVCSNQLASLLHSFDAHFSQFEVSEFRRIFDEFDLHLSKYETMQWALAHSIPTEVTPRFNESEITLHFCQILRGIGELLLLMKIPIQVMLRRPVNGDTASWGKGPLATEFNQVLDMDVDIICKGTVEGHELMLPIKMNANIGSVIDAIESTSKVGKEDDQKLIQQCITYCLQTKSKTCVLSDFYKTLIFEIDTTNSLGNDGLHFKHVVVDSEATGLSLRKAILWVLYRSFKIQTLDEIAHDRLELRELAERLKRTPSETKAEEKRLSLPLREELSKYGEIKELSVEDLELEVIERSTNNSTCTMPFHKFKKFFKQDSQDEGFEKVLIKVWNPQGAECNHPAIVDRELEEGTDLQYRVELCQSEMVDEAINLKKVQSEDVTKANQSRVLDSGNCEIYDKYGLIQHIGLYIVTSIEQ